MDLMAIAMFVKVIALACIILYLWNRIPRNERLYVFPVIVIWSLAALAVISLVFIDLTGGSRMLRYQVVHYVGSICLYAGLPAIFLAIVGTHAANRAPDSE